MDKKLKAKWLKALRSGKYKQGIGALWHQKDDAYCCVGVLCRVQGASDRFLKKNARKLHFGPRYGAGMAPYDFRPFAWMNDEGKSFEEIANAIEEML